MITSLDCKTTTEQLGPYVENALSQEEALAIDQHVHECGICREALRRVKAMYGLLEYAELASSPENTTGNAAAVNSVVAPSTVVATGSAITEFLSRAPWWCVSMALHVLIIALAGLVTMAIEMPRTDDSVIMVTDLAARPTIDVEQPKEKAEIAEALAPRGTVTDPTSINHENISIPADILKNAELGDHFETINPDRPDSGSAFGNPDSDSFHSLTDSADAAGGGGMGGISLEDVVGVGGSAGRGKGGGFGGGDGTGVGTGSGRGTGTFGPRDGAGRKAMVKKNGGSPATESAVDRGLEWLARNQDADGHWDAIKFGAVEGKWTTCRETLELADTGLALLAFLGAGHTEKIGKYKENVIRGLRWLKAKQDYETGRYGMYNYGHAIAGMAMAEAAGMARVPDTIESAQKALDYTAGVKANHQTSDRGGWNYIPPQLGEVAGDMSNSGWAMMFLKSAKVAGLKVPHESIEGVNSYLNACERDKGNGDGYSGHKYSYGPGPIYADQKNRGYIAILGRLFFGTPANEVEDGAKYMIQLRGLPSSGLVADGAWKDGATVDLYYDYYMTLITFQIGGDMWDKWNTALKNAIPKLQVKGGADDGSWEPRGAFNENWGRVGQTALSILCMEVYYRYKKLSER